MNQEFARAGYVSVRDKRRERKKLAEYLSRRAGDSHVAKRKEDDFVWEERRNLQAIMELLPKFEGRDLKEILQGLSPHSRVLDLGCGDAAVALSELSALYPQLECYGVTYPVEREYLPELPPGVHRHRVDANDFFKYSGLYLNLIYSSQAVRYFIDPWRTIKLAYAKLADNGILLIDFIFNMARPIILPNGELVTAEILEGALQQAGYNVEIREVFEKPGMGLSFAIRKNDRKRLHLPICLIDNPNKEEEYAYLLQKGI